MLHYNASAQTINLVSWTTAILAYVYSYMEAQVNEINQSHYSDVIMSAMASQISRLTIVYSTVYSGADQIKHQSPTSLAFVRGIHRWPVNSPHKAPVTRKMFPYGDVIMLPQLTFVTLSTSDILGLYNAPVTSLPSHHKIKENMICAVYSVGKNIIIQPLFTNTIT